MSLLTCDPGVKELLAITIGKEMLDAACEEVKFLLVAVNEEKPVDLTLEIKTSHLALRS